MWGQGQGLDTSIRPAAKNCPRPSQRAQGLVCMILIRLLRKHRMDGRVKALYYYCRDDRSRYEIQELLHYKREAPAHRTHLAMRLFATEWGSGVTLCRSRMDGLRARG